MKPSYNLIMLTGDSSIARGIDGAFNQLLAEFSRYWQRIDILTPQADTAQSRVIHDHVYIHPAPRHRALQPLFILQKVGELVRERDYHLMTSHDFGFFYNGWGALVASRRYQIPLVSEIHHVEGYPLAVNRRERLWRQAAKVYLPLMNRQAVGVRVVNQQLPDLLTSLGVEREKIHVLSSLYLDLNQCVEVPSDNPPYDVLFVGRLASNKGIMLILEAIRRLKPTIPTITLAIRGDGALRSQIDRFIQQHQLMNHIHFVPRVADSAAMGTLYQQAKMLVCASTVEGNPRVTAEAMACGVPVISTRVGIMPELIEDGKNGYLIEHDPAQLAATIRQLLSDDKQRRTIGQAGRDAVQSYAASDTIAAYAHAYHRIIEETRQNNE